MTGTQRADLTMMRVIHRAFRRDLARLVALAEEEPRHRGLADGWALVRGQLELHHSSEDARLWPALRAKLDPGAEEHALLDRMTHEHEGLEPLIRAVDGRLADEARRGELATAFRALAAALDDHLAHEEERVVPLLESVLTAADLAEFEELQKRKLGVRGAAVFFPWLLDDGLDDDLARVVLDQLPPPLRALARTRWRTAYRRKNAHWHTTPQPHEESSVTPSTNVAVIYYSATGTVHRLAEAVATGAEKAGATVRLLRVPELAPESAIQSNPAWAAHVAETADVAVADLPDLEWADAVILGAPTRFGLPPAQLKEFIDRTGGLWYQKKLVDKVYASFTSTSTPHGGQESTILALNNTFYHWGGFIVPPGYTNDEEHRIGNPYGVGHVSANGTIEVGDDELRSAEYLGRRVAEVAQLLKLGRAAA